MSNWYRFQIVVLGLLLVTGATGMILLADYAARPDADGRLTCSLRLSELAEVATADPNRKTVVVFYHPQCPCTVATARVLERMVPNWLQPPRMIAVAYCPSEFSRSWIETATTNVMRRIPNMQVVCDRDGRFCQSHGITTSGHVLVFSERGNMIFSGGITPYRGHEGSSIASDRLDQCINDHSAKPSSWPVFGCRLAPCDERCEK